MIEREHRLPVRRQAELMGISQGAVDYPPVPMPNSELALMRSIDALHLDHPYPGSRKLRDLLRLQGVEVGRRHVATLMRRVGIRALYRKLRTSRNQPAHPFFPYVLRGLAIERANQVWALGIPCVPMARRCTWWRSCTDTNGHGCLQTGDVVGRSGHYAPRPPASPRASF